MSVHHYKRFLPAAQLCPYLCWLLLQAQPSRRVLVPAGYLAIALWEPCAATRRSGPWYLLWLMWSESYMRRMFLYHRYDYSNAIMLWLCVAELGNSSPLSLSLQLMLWESVPVCQWWRELQLNEGSGDVCLYKWGCHHITVQITTKYWS